MQLHLYLPPDSFKGALPILVFKTPLCVRVWREADVGVTGRERPLLTQSGHPHRRHEDSVPRVR
jgi:hypothetical protein